MSRHCQRVRTTAYLSRRNQSYDDPRNPRDGAGTLALGGNFQPRSQAGGFDGITIGSSMRLLLIGDIVGKPGRQIVCQALPSLIEREQLDLVVANGENGAGGSGITPAIYHELRGAGGDVVTLGDHIYRRAEVFDVIDKEANIINPANFPSEAAGHDCAVVKSRNGVSCAVFSLLGRVFMRPVD